MTVRLIFLCSSFPVQCWKLQRVTTKVPRRPGSRFKTLYLQPQIQLLVLVCKTGNRAASSQAVRNIFPMRWGLIIAKKWVRRNKTLCEMKPAVTNINILPEVTHILVSPFKPSGVRWDRIFLFGSFKEWPLRRRYFNLPASCKFTVFNCRYSERSFVRRMVHVTGRVS